MCVQEHQQTCNVMMIEQVLAIPTSGGGTSQATIQIPANLGPDTRLILDGQSITVEGQAISVNKHGGVSIMVSGGKMAEFSTFSFFCYFVCSLVIIPDKVAQGLTRNFFFFSCVTFSGGVQQLFFQIMRVCLYLFLV